MKLNLKDTFNKELPVDANKENISRQVEAACFSYVAPTKTANPKLVHASKASAALLGLDEKDIASDDFLQIFSGNKLIKDSEPYAMCYGGHQFGNWAGQLGDGRAINLGEVEHDGKSFALQLKGSGKTPYSRNADGLAVLRSSIREHLCSEAMFHLGVPTTRSLSLMLTGDQVLRDMLYDGNPAYEKGAVVCRMAPSFIRFGNFQIFAARKDYETLKKLADYTIKHFYPAIKLDGKEKYIELFKAVSDRTLKMVVDWQRVGFVHGVMNTDNMSILGLTIDYGPYGWLDNYDPNWTPNTTDKSQKRYRFGHQPQIVLWNLLQLANALFPLVNESKPFETILDSYKSNFQVQYKLMMKKKLGLQEDVEADEMLIGALEKLLQSNEIDMTIFYRKLSDLKKTTPISKEALVNYLEASFYNLEDLENDEIIGYWVNWFTKYTERLTAEMNSDIERKVLMDKINPKYVLRNYMAQMAIDASDAGDYSLVEELHQLLKQPYAEQENMTKWFAKRPDWARHKVGCSMLSCSS